MNSNRTKHTPSLPDRNKKTVPSRQSISLRPAEKSATAISQPEIDKLVALFSRQQYAKVVALARTQIEHSPASGISWKALGAALKQLGYNADALGPMQKAAALLPEDAETYNNLGALLYELGQLDEAISCCQQAIRIKPNYPEAYCNQGLVLMAQGKPGEADACYCKALYLDPHNFEALLGMGDLQLENGQEEAAETFYRQALQVRPASMAVRYSLTFSRNRQDENLAALLDVAEAVQNHAASLPHREQAYLHFALGRCYEQREDYEQAFAHFQQGCKLKRTELHYDPARIEQQFSSLMKIIDQGAINRLSGAGHPSRLPIFILGMPRSGTTLVEQILASHPSVYGAGELPDLMRIVRQSPGHLSTEIPFPDNLRALDQASLTAWGTQYAERLKQRNESATHITDKMPENFLAVGLIRLMLPNAKIIHVKRDPVDTCVSCYIRPFSVAHGNTYDLFELGQYYVYYTRLMEHWRNILPAGAFLDVHYENLATDPEAQTRRILEYCGLEWNEACLNFHNNPRWVRSASTLQIRKPLYTSSIGRWRHYEKFLGPLFDALGNMAPRLPSHPSQ